MPIEMEKALKKIAKKKFPKDKERQNAYIYGTMRHSGWKPNKELHDSRGRRGPEPKK